MKKTVSVLLLIVMVASMLCVPAFAIKNESAVPAGQSISDPENYYHIKVDYFVYFVLYGKVVGYNNITTGYEVEVVQIVMNRINSVYSSVSCNAGAVDGIFGQNTWQAVYNFQVWRGLSADGIVGPNTWAEMESVCY